MAQKFTWEVHPDLLSSDHFPILIKLGVRELYAHGPVRWKVDKADWPKFRTSVSLPSVFHDSNSACRSVVTALMEACDGSVPRTSGIVSAKYCCYWWDDNCSSALGAAKRQLRLLNRNHNPANVAEYKHLDAIASRTLLEAKISNWRQNLSTVNKDTDVRQVWKVIKSLDGKPRTSRKIVLSIEGNLVSDLAVIAHALGEYYLDVSSDNNYHDDLSLMSC